MTSRPTETGSQKRRGPALPGLNQRTPSPRLGERLVRVAEDDHPRPGRSAFRAAPLERVRADERAVVEQEHGRAAEVEQPALGQQPRPAAVDVAAHGDHGRELAELLEHVAAADVARVQDHVGARERLDRLRPDEAVRVGDDPDGQLRATGAAPPGRARPRARRERARGRRARRTTVEPRLKAPSSSPRESATGRVGLDARTPAAPRFVTRSVKARLIRPTFAAPTRTTATGPCASRVQKRATRSLRVKRPGIDAHAGGVDREQAARHVAPRADAAVHRRVDAVVHRRAEVQRRVDAARGTAPRPRPSRGGPRSSSRALDLLEPAVGRDEADRADSRASHGAVTTPGSRARPAAPSRRRRVKKALKVG